MDHSTAEHWPSSDMMSPTSAKSGTRQMAFLTIFGILCSVSLHLLLLSTGKMASPSDLKHAHELMGAHPLIDSHVDLPYVMRAVRESESQILFWEYECQLTLFDR